MLEKVNYFGYNMPFRGGHQNVLSKQSGDRIIKNDLIQLIMTYPGERIMRPNWGTLVKKSVFEPLDEGSMIVIKENIKEAISTWEPRIEANVSLAVDSANNMLKISIIGTYTDLPNSIFEQELEVPLNTTVRTG